MKKTQLIPAAGYIRMSTDKQEDSPARQKAEILQLAKREGYEIIVWYEDHGLTGTESANRPEFLRLLADAKEGNFEAILVYENSRLSREHPLEAMAHWRLLWEAKITVVSVMRGKVNFDDIGGIVTLMVDQHGAHEESIKIAHRSVSGRIFKAERGERVGGSLFAYDREVYDASGQLVKVVHFREPFQKPPGWQTKIVPSQDVEAVDATVWAFDSFQRGVVSLSEIAREINSRGIKTKFGNSFDQAAVRVMLRNPTYIGTLRAGTHCTGKFRRMDEDQRTFIHEDAHPAIIEKRVFLDVQLLMDKRNRPKTNKANYLLRGILFCGQCGNKLVGSFQNATRNGAGARKRYICAKLRDGSNENCPGTSIGGVAVERFVVQAILDKVLCESNHERLLSGCDEPTNRVRSPDELQLVDLRKKIDRATENLALAESKDECAAVSKLRSEWLSSERDLIRKIDRSSTRKLRPGLLECFERLAEIRENIHEADPGLLVLAIRESIERITVQRDKTSGEWSGTIDLIPEISVEREIPILHSDILPRHLWFKAVLFIGSLGRTVSALEIAEHLGIERVNVYRIMRTAVNSNRVTHYWGNGWECVEPVFN